MKTFDELAEPLDKKALVELKSPAARAERLREEGRRIWADASLDPMAKLKALLAETVAAAELPRGEFILKITTRTGYNCGRLLAREYGMKFFLYALLALASSMDDSD